MYLLLKGKLLDSLPPSSRKGAEARNMMSASGKLQVEHHVVTLHTSHLTPHTLFPSREMPTRGARSVTRCGRRATSRTLTPCSPTRSTRSRRAVLHYASAASLLSTSRAAAGVCNSCRQHEHAVQIARHVTCWRFHWPGPLRSNPFPASFLIRHILTLPP
jgi:hypothetical protein